MSWKLGQTDENCAKCIVREQVLHHKNVPRNPKYRFVSRSMCPDLDFFAFSPTSPPLVDTVYSVVYCVRLYARYPVLIERYHHSGYVILFFSLSSKYCIGIACDSVVCHFYGQHFWPLRITSYWGFHVCHVFFFVFFSQKTSTLHESFFLQINKQNEFWWFDVRA